MRNSLLKKCLNPLALLGKELINLLSKRDLVIIIFFTILGLGGVFAATLVTVTAPDSQGAGYLAATTCDENVTIRAITTSDSASGQMNVSTIALSDVDQRYDANGINGCGLRGLELALRVNGAMRYTSWSIPVDSGSNTFTYGGATSSYGYAANTVITPFNVSSLDYVAIRVIQVTLSGSLNFVDNTYKINYTADNTFALGTNDFTVDLWAKVSSSSANATFYDAGGDVNSAGGFAFWVEAGILKLRYNGTGHDLSAAFTYDNAWHHYAAVRSGTSYKIYVDGILVASATYASYDIDRTAPVVGALSNFPLNYSLIGEIRNLRVVKGTALWTNTFTPPVVPLANVSGTVLLLLVQNPTNPTYDSSNYHWVPANTSKLPTYVAP
ncbi:MAG: LamG domain-containing protein [Candidatus Nanopelagicus sp.]|nr:LamG domain-containing protein [Candidatus Nanopelagicus sp.]